MQKCVNFMFDKFIPSQNKLKNDPQMPFICDYLDLLKL